MTFDEDMYVGVGTVIRFIPSEADEAFRGYDVVIRETISEGRQYLGETIFLRVRSRVPGFSGGVLALVVAMRTDRAVVFTPGVCTPLVEVTESQLDGVPQD
jgi:hypothetical protein